jgi:hypothetical protein
MPDDARPVPPATGRPIPLGPERVHYLLVLGMAQTVGVDLAREMAAGRLTQADWAGMVHRCRGCDWAAGCRSWLHDHPHAAAAPAPCRNAARFEGMREARRDARDR